MMRRTTFAAFAVWMAMTAGACADADSPVVVLDNVVPAPNCVIPAEDYTFNARGRLDVAGGVGYLFTPVVQNFATSDTVEDRQRLAVVEGAELAITLPDGLFAAGEVPAELLSFSSRFSTTIFPNNSVSSLAFVILPAELAELIAPKLVPGQLVGVQIEIKIFGEIAGGEFESPPFVYWVDVCVDCVLQSVGSCAAPLPAGTGNFDQMNSCNPWQDGFVECCESSTGGLVCPAQSEVIEPAP